jgi:hypothetical protein
MIDLVSDNLKKANFKYTMKLYILVLAAALGLYALTCSPGFLWQDSGMYQYRIWHGDIEGGLGLALSHPLYHIIGIAVKAIPLGEFPFRINMISAVCGAVTVANIFLLVWLWGRNIFAAFLSAISIGLSWTFWQHSVITECYTLYTAVFSLELVCLYLYFAKGQNKWLYWTAFLNGLSISNHLWGILPLAIYGLLATWLIYKKRMKPIGLLSVLFLWIAGASIYLSLIIKALVAGGDFIAVMQSALFGSSWSEDVLNTTMTGKVFAENLLFIFYNFATPNLLLVIGGMYFIYKYCKLRVFSAVFAAITVLFFVFAFRYTVPDRYAFFLPFYCMVSILVGLGGKILFEKFTNKTVLVLLGIFALMPIAVYIITPVIAENQGINLGTRRDIPYRNDYTYFLRPWQQSNNAPERFAKQAMTVADNNDFILADGTTVYALWYAKQQQDINSNVKILSGHGNYNSPAKTPQNKNELLEMMQKGDVFVVSPVKGYCADFILQGFNFQKQGVLYKVIAKPDTKSSNRF